MIDKRAFYFGCLKECGHYLHDLNGKTRATEGTGMPWNIGHLDTGLLTNGNVPDVVDGRVYWTCGSSAGGRPPFWFVFYWWDRSVDIRPGSNSAFCVSGYELNQVREAFEFACRTYPNVVERQSVPLKLTGVCEHD